MPTNYGPIAVNPVTGALTYATTDLATSGVALKGAAQTFTEDQTIESDNKILFGADVEWKRIQANVIGAGADDSLFIYGNMNIARDAAAETAFGAVGPGGVGGVNINPGGGDTILYRSATAKLAVNSDFSVETAGKGLRVKEGSNAKQGVSTLVAGAVVVSNTSVTANSRIFLTVQSLGTVAAPKAIAVTARTAATSFTITSADGTDTSVVAWQIFEPA